MKMKKYKITLVLEGEGDKFEKAMKELKADILSGVSQRELSEDADISKAKMIFEEIKD